MFQTSYNHTNMMENGAPFIERLENYLNKSLVDLTIFFLCCKECQIVYKYFVYKLIGEPFTIIG